MSMSNFYQVQALFESIGQHRVEEKNVYPSTSIRCFIGEHFRLQSDAINRFLHIEPCRSLYLFDQQQYKWFILVQP